jgi:hypothetical protein
MTRRYVSLEGAKSTLRANMARGVAATLISGINHAEAEGHPLSELQQIDLATIAVMSYYDAIVAGESSLEVECSIGEMVVRK